MSDSIWFLGEEFKPIPSRPNCYASAMGGIMSCRCGGVLIQNGTADKDGYRFVTKPKRLIHHLVLEAWGFPKPFEKAQVRHLNDKPGDNRLCNIAWGTSKENGADKARSGNGKGSRNGAAKMSEEIVLKLREEGKNKPLSFLISLYPEYSKFAIWAALTGYTWTHLPNAKKSNRKCSKDGWKQGVRLRQ